MHLSTVSFYIRLQMNNKLIIIETNHCYNVTHIELIACQGSPWARNAEMRYALYAGDIQLIERLQPMSPTLFTLDQLSILYYCQDIRMVATTREKTHNHKFLNFKTILNFSQGFNHIRRQILRKNEGLTFNLAQSSSRKFSFLGPWRPLKVLRSNFRIF